MSTPIDRRRALTLGAAALALPLVPRRADAANLPLRIGVFATEGAAQAYYANELGYFKDAGIDATLTTIPSAAAIAAAVSSGSLDLGFGSAVPLAAARARGINFRIVASAVIYSGPPPMQAMAVAKGSTVQKATDLNGQTIAVNGLREFSDLDARAWLEKNGADLNSIKIVEIPFPAMADALKAGRVACAAMGEPYVSSARNDVRVIGDPLSAVGTKFAMTVWFGAQTWLDANPDAGKRFQTAMRRAATWANSHRAESTDLLAKYTKLTPDNLATMVRSTYADTPPTPELIQPVVDVAVKYGGLAPIKADDLIWHAPK
jgi:NitT/TauT family transport system substrate-binding protein